MSPAQCWRTFSSTEPAPRSASSPTTLPCLHDNGTSGPTGCTRLHASEISLASPPLLLYQVKTRLDSKGLVPTPLQTTGCLGLLAPTSRSPCTSNATLIELSFRTEGPPCQQQVWLQAALWHRTKWPRFTPSFDTQSHPPGNWMSGATNHLCDTRTSIGRN